MIQNKDEKKIEIKNIVLLQNINEIKNQNKEEQFKKYSYSKINNINNIQKKNEINTFSGKEINNEINILRIDENQNINESQNNYHLNNKCKNEKFILINEFLKNSKIKMEIMKIKQKLIYLVSKINETL